MATLETSVQAKMSQSKVEEDQRENGEEVFEEAAWPLETGSRSPWSFCLSGTSLH